MTPNTSAISYFSQFYDDTEHFARLFDRVGRQLAFRGRTRRDALAWQPRLRRKLVDVLGLDTFTSTRPRPKLVDREDLGEYWREDWRIHTEPDVIATFYALVPKGITKGQRRPAVICPHGHGSGGRFSPAGRDDLAAIAEQIKVYNYDYAVQLARRGLVTFAMDARGFGQRRVQAKREDKKDPALFLASSCHELMLMGHPLGQSVAGMWTWDLLRLVDCVVSRPEVDPERVGCAGLSGGGLQTLYLSALDKRIKAAVVSGYFYGVKDSLIRLAGNCDCNCVPQLWKYADLGDVAGLIAPRGLFIETGDKDPLNGAAGSLANVRSQVRAARKVYRALGVKESPVHHVFPGEHRWCGERSIPWLEKRLAR
ncbi:acetylxylan esterase [bacterium]|nr:acetylxylan esterase [bacterium]